jgi:hypothetical protein
LERAQRYRPSSEGGIHDISPIAAMNLASPTARDRTHLLQCCCRGQTQLYRELHPFTRGRS